MQHYLEKLDSIDKQETAKEQQAINELEKTAKAFHVDKLAALLDKKELNNQINCF